MLTNGKRYQEGFFLNLKVRSRNILCYNFELLIHVFTTRSILLYTNLNDNNDKFLQTFYLFTPHETP